MAKNIYKSIAQQTAKTAWQLGGKVLGHGLLALSVYKLIGARAEDKTSEQKGFFTRARETVLGSEKESSIFSRWGKKFLSLGVAEAIAQRHPVQNATAETWDQLEPIAVKFMTPIIQTVEEPVIKSLVDNGYMRLYGSSTEEYSDKILSAIKPTILDKLGSYLSEVKDNVSLLSASDRLRQGLIYLEKNAPAAGEKVATVMKDGYQYAAQAIDVGSKAIQAPSRFLDAAEEALTSAGATPSLALLGGAALGALGVLSYFTLFGTRMSQSQSQTAAAAASGNTVNNFFVVPTAEATDTGTPVKALPTVKTHKT